MAHPDHMALCAFQRFGLGATTGNHAAVSRDPRGACLAEITPEAGLILDATLPKTARGIQIVSEIEERRREMREAARKIAQTNGPQSATPIPGMMAEPAPMGMVANAPSPALRDPDEVRLGDVFNAELKARFTHGIAQNVGFAERWAMFWSNHFCIATRRGQILRGIAGAYEREAIRPHVFGQFTDLLVAVETHPAMLHFLDQRQSIGPNSPAGQRRKRGLNENLAREILELHTLGVGGGYSQADVTGFAKVLTGWSITNQEENLDGYGAFFFAPNRHEPGAQIVLGKSYAEDGKAQGMAILRDLARHRATAKFIATKIARHFVADQPPAALVSALEVDFNRSGGDLASLARTLLRSDVAWSAPLSKLRTPAEFLLAALRATGEKPERPGQIVNALNLMGQPLWNPAGPNGHPDDEVSIAAPKAIKTRMDLALQFVRPLAARLDPRELAGGIFGEALSSPTKIAIARAETRPQGLALLLMSPEFQRR